MDDLVPMQRRERAQALPSDLLHALHREVFGQPALVNVLVDVVEVVPQQLVDDEEGLPVVEAIEQPRQALLLLFVHLGGQELQQLHLPEVLVQDVLGVLRDFHAHKAVRPLPLEVLALDRVAERARAEVLDDEVASRYDLLFLHVKVVVRLQARRERVIDHVHRELVNRCGLALPIVSLSVEHGLGLHEQLARNPSRADGLGVVELAQPAVVRKRRQLPMFGWRCRERRCVGRLDKRHACLGLELRHRDRSGLSATQDRIVHHGLMQAVEHGLEGVLTEPRADHFDRRAHLECAKLVTEGLYTRVHELLS
mmetsp:Transcript_23676/g.48095  ORF Transcript_23676/g.48095 Transcript_23676/m.48095 type:complete len:310 (-) Transcript_23676:44-973(-)